MERDPIILFSCTIGLFGARPEAHATGAKKICAAAPLAPYRNPPFLAGFLAPVVWGDGGRAREEAATSFAYRIKHVYPNEK